MLLRPQSPPMGWNSWDCYGASVTEEEVRGNARYMAEHLKEYGWEYVVTDIQWYEPTADSTEYHPFVPLCMDAHSRLIPAENRFPSAADGQGFAPLAAFVHSLGLKFGIHIMRGIPRQAVHANTPILGTDACARDIALSASICTWNTDMYGVDASKPGAQEYYDSLFSLYAQWGVDYVKVDDIARNDVTKGSYCAGEVELIHRAIERCGRGMLLSLSPGPAPLEQAEHLKKHANLWRITDDLWDIWELVEVEFERCRLWAPYTGPGHFPDADMLPFGHLSIRGCPHGMGERWTCLTQEEQVLVMTLWSIFRSPLMFGGELRDNDAFTLSLLQNREVLAVNQHAREARQVLRDDGFVVWKAAGEAGAYVALFNLSNEEREYACGLAPLYLAGTRAVRDLWAGEDLPAVSDTLCCRIPAHGARLFAVR